jgi:hypothetical protein
MTAGRLTRPSSAEQEIGEVVRFIPKHELERAFLIQEARAIYEGIFPTETYRASQ